MHHAVVVNGGSKGAPETCPPIGSISFIFLQFSANIFPNNRFSAQTQRLVPSSSGISWIRQWLWIYPQNCYIISTRGNRASLVHFFHLYAVFRKNYAKQECIPVGCVPAASRPYAGVCFPGGWRVSVPGGGCLLLEGGVSAPGGCLLLGGGGSMH